MSSESARVRRTKKRLTLKSRVSRYDLLIDLILRGELVQDLFGVSKDLRNFFAVQIGSLHRVIHFHV